ncbi:MAG: hypothetical protein JNM07_14180, partial [Phycisphaerae bacterium]|nr:hypothetical protein [Phycisphaerae bacterium]
MARRTMGTTMSPHVAPHLHAAEHVAVHLGVQPAQGLPEAEAASRLAQHGPNRLPEPPPRYATLSLPAECIAPSEPVRDSDPADWQPRAAVLVHDDDQGAYFNGVAVTFIYADGREEPVTTRAGGYAFAADAGAMP